MRQLRWYFLLFIIISISGCAKIISVERLPDISLGEATFFPTIEAHTDAAITSGNRIDILLNGDDTFPIMLRDIKAAKSTITFAQYLVEGGSLAKQFAEVFAERCRAGVKADILLDSHGSGKTPADILALMRDAGCRVEFFRRVEAPAILFPWKLLQYNYRSHRRILVIDGKIGFTGGYGIADAWLGNGRTEGQWRDTNARIEGPAVKFLQAAFAESWLETTAVAIGGQGYFPRLEPTGNIPAQIVSSSPAGGSFQNYMLFLLSINSARKSILITNPYFIPDSVMTEALLKAVSRGVRVVVLTPGKIDSRLTYVASRSHYGEMLAGGVEIYEYQAGLMHAKTMVVDGIWATIGSTNFDNRSFALNQELNLTVHDGSITRRLENIFHEDLKYAKRITYEEWQSRSIFERLFELFAFPVKEQL
jgi:cardiolipin synthase A/B